jgi:hypothetical protein
MKKYEIWIHVEEIDGDQNHHLDLDMPYKAGCFKTEAKARKYVENELMTTRLNGSAADLLEACKALTSYTSELLYRLDNQVNPSDIDEIRQAKEVIARYCPAKTTPTSQFRMTLREQSPCFEPKTTMLKLLEENGQLWIQPQGYGEKCTEDGEGSPVGMEIWEGRLRLVVFNNINSEDPQIMDLENAKETARLRCNWCKKEIQAGSIQWKGLLFCSDVCLDACRAVQ